MEEEFFDIDNRKAWTSVYQEIRNKSNNCNYSCKEAKKSENKNLNRYRDVNPFDHSRIRLRRGDEDYINASLVQVPTANRSYILTQGPLPTTIGHFWLMIWEQKSNAILMLNRVIEKNTIKCHQYWPCGNDNDGGDEIMLKDVGLLVSFISQTVECNYTVRKFLLTDFQSGKSRIILQFHYTTWPDFGVPESPAAFLNFLFAVREAGVLNESNGPAIVHCSAGIGRSGTFCLVDSCLVLIEQKGNSEFLNICELLLQMRQYRMGLIQTPGQLRFSYLAVIEGSRLILNSTLSNIEAKQETLQSDKAKFRVPGETQRNSNQDLIEGHKNSPPPLPPRPVYKYNSLVPQHKSNLNEDNDLSIQDSFHKNSLSMPSVSDEPKTCETLSSYSTISNNISVEENCINKRRKSSDNTETNQNFEDSVSELKKRKRKERSEKTAAIVQKIKKKQKEAEVWQKRRSLIKHISFGFVILFGTGVFIYKCCSKS